MRKSSGHSLWKFFYNLITKYPTPGILNYSWNYGVLLQLALAIQVITGIILEMFYTAHIEFAFFFFSVEYIFLDCLLEKKKIYIFSEKIIQANGWYDCLLFGSMVIGHISSEIYHYHLIKQMIQSVDCILWKYDEKVEIKIALIAQKHTVEVLDVTGPQGFFPPPVSRVPDNIPYYMPNPTTCRTVGIPMPTGIRDPRSPHTIGNFTQWGHSNVYTNTTGNVMLLKGRSTMFNPGCMPIVRGYTIVKRYS